MSRILISAIHLPVCVARQVMWALREMGHEVETIGPAQGAWLPWATHRDMRPYEWTPTYGGEHVEGRAYTFNPLLITPPDLIIQFDSVVKNMWGCPNVLWAIDNHVGEYVMHETFDRIYVAHSWGHMADLPNATWLPAGYDPRTHYVICESAPRDIDVLLVGNMYPERIELVAQLRAVGINVVTDLGLVYDEYNRLYNRAKIALVKSKCGDLSTRVFENMAAGCLVVSDRYTDLEKIGFVGHEPRCLLTYKTVEDCINTIHMSLNSFAWQGLSKEFALAGRAAIANHTWAHRLEVILKDAGL